MRPKNIFPLLLIAFSCGALLFAAYLASYALPAQDMTQWWSAAHLVRSNPYSFQAVADFEKASGISVSTPLIIKNPPWAIVLLLPLGLLGYHLAFAFWALMSVVVIAGCTYAISRKLYPRESLAPALLPFVFGPTFVLLMLGQYTVLVLLGAVLFCHLVRNRHDWLAGASLILVLGKPHIALLFLIAVCLWVVHTKRWAILISGSLTLIFASLVALLINHHMFQQFRERSLLVVHETESYPNLGGMLYSVSGIHLLALLPQIAGLVWVFFYWKRRRFDWSWEREGMLVLLVSVTCSYYSYPYDQILGLPALVYAFATGNRRGFLVAFALSNLGYVVYISNVAGLLGFGYMFLWWTGLGWLAAYLLAKTRFLMPASA